MAWADLIFFQDESFPGCSLIAAPLVGSKSLALVGSGLILPVTSCLLLMRNQLRRGYGLDRLDSSCLSMTCRLLRCW
ncbi:hypothetical protein TNCT_60471 [Trichonephila clavata]|uniref:Uncharacterized protein n=1 Tax=Trichonephila clavata TaxID=2740835 RepID=A0A8X6KRB6_TRICU|nr:hypothetical protein TNCT_60471 [Trichonephila clavata]